MSGSGVAAIVSLAFSPDGERLAAGDRDGGVTLWDRSTLEPEFSRAAHDGPVFATVFSPDGLLLATAGDNIASLWDVAKGQEVARLEGHSEAVFSVAFSPDGRRLATASFDGTASVWLVGRDDLIALARSRVTRGLTDDECRQYLHVDACPAVR